MGRMADPATKEGQEALKANEAAEEEAIRKAEEEFLITPIHDTGSKWYAVLSFFLPILGVIAALVFRHFNHKRNAKACKKGAIIGFITIAAVIVLFAILLVLAVI